MTDTHSEARQRKQADILKYFNNGEKCILWGVPVSDMGREELISFIGFLDEHITFLNSGGEMGRL